MEKMDEWQERLDGERQLKVERLACGVGQAHILKSTHPSILFNTKGNDQLKDLGLLSEVKTVIEEMDREDKPEYLAQFLSSLLGCIWASDQRRP